METITSPFVLAVKFLLVDLVVLVTTNCVISELVSLGKELGGAVFIAKRFQLRTCGHGKKGVTATQCVLSLIGMGF